MTKPFDNDTFTYSDKREELKEARKIIRENEDLDSSTKKDISSALAKNKWYSPMQYVEAFFSFFNLQNNDGERSFYNDKAIINVLDNINPSSTDASYLQTIYELVQEGAMEAETLSMFNKKDFRFNEALKGDLETLYTVIENNRDKSKLKDELLEAYIPTVKTQEEGLEKSKIGDAFQVENEKTIRIKTNDNSSEQMHLSKKAYNELFPMFKRFSSIQGWLFGDCYLIEPLMLLYQEPSERAHIVSMFREQKGGNISVVLPNALEKTTFKKGEMPEEETNNDDAYSTGAKGFRLLEYAYARNERARLIQQAKEVREGSQLEKFEKFLAKNGENIYIDNTATKAYKKYSAFQKETDGLDDTFCQYILANGGQPRTVLRNLGYTDVKDYSPIKKDKKVIGFAESPEDGYKKESQFQRELQNLPMMETDNFIKMIEKMGGKDNTFDVYNVFLAINNHAYGLKFVENNKGIREYYLYDPHSHAIPEKIDNLKDVLEKSKRIVFAKKSGLTPSEQSLQEALEKIKNNSDINPKIKEHLIELCANSKYYKPSEYVDNFYSLCRFQNDDGESSFYNFDAIEDILEVNPASVKASYLQTIIELAQIGVIKPDVLYSIKPKCELNDSLIDDIEKLYSVVVNNKDAMKLDDELLEAYIPTVKNIDEGLKKAKEGDAFQIEGEKYIRIKTSDNHAELMHISKETYNELFPMFERFTGVQGDLFGDCYLIEPLMLLYQDKHERAHIVSMFKEHKKGDIVVQFPNGIEKTVFKKGEMPQEEDNYEAYVVGAKGFKLLEYAFARNERALAIKAAREVREGTQLEKFEKFLAENKENIFIDDTKARRYKKYSTYLKQENSDDDTFCQYLIANGGRATHTLDVLGYDVANYSSVFTQRKRVIGFVPTPPEEGKTREELEKELLELDRIDIDAFGNIMNDKKNDIFDSFNIFVAMDEHQYGLKKVTNKYGRKELHLYNPHYQTTPKKVKSLKELLKKVSRIDFAQKTQY